MRSQRYHPAFSRTKGFPPKHRNKLQEKATNHQPSLRSFFKTSQILPSLLPQPEKTAAESSSCRSLQIHLVLHQLTALLQLAVQLAQPGSWSKKRCFVTFSWSCGGYYGFGFYNVAATWGVFNRLAVVAWYQSYFRLHVPMVAWHSCCLIVVLWSWIL